MAQHEPSEAEQLTAEIKRLEAVVGKLESELFMNKMQQAACWNQSTALQVKNSDLMAMNEALTQELIQQKQYLDMQDEAMEEALEEIQEQSNEIMKLKTSDTARC